MTRYTLAYYGRAIRGPFTFATEAALAAVFAKVPNPEGLDVVPVHDDGAPLDTQPLHLPIYLPPAPEVMQ